MCLVRSWKTNNTNDEMLQLWCELRLSRQVWIISFLYALHPPSPYHAKSESSKLPKKRWGFSVSPRLVLKKPSQTIPNLNVSWYSKHWAQIRRRTHITYFFRFNRKHITGPNVSKVVVTSFFHPWPELITQVEVPSNPWNSATSKPPKFGRKKQDFGGSKENHPTNPPGLLQLRFL